MKKIKKYGLLLMVLFILFVITGCTSSSDFFTFTGDRPARGDVRGTIEERSIEDNPIEGASIRVEDSNMITHSDSDGSYILTGVNNNSVISVAIDGYESESRTVVIEDDGDEDNIDFRLNKAYEDFIFELTWQKGPEDLDAHLIVPADPNNSEQDSYNIYYQDQGNDSEYPNAFLDRDVLTYDNDHDKPEVITIKELYQGRYTYFIKNFSMFEAEDEEEISEISESGAMVKVRENGEWTQYNVPEDQAGMYWLLFEIEVTEDGYEIIEINEITDDIGELDPERD